MRPFAWLAVLAFVIGFMGQVILGQAGAPATGANVSLEHTVSGPASDDWNPPHHI
jgi:hypothetical protein